MGQYGISQPISRIEDNRLLRGEGRFIDDVLPPGTVHGVFFRAPLAHAEIRNLDVAAAKAAPGVLDVITAADLTADGIGQISYGVPPKLVPGTELIEHRCENLAVDKVRYVGEAIAFVVAESREQARDAAELIDVDFTDLPATTDCRAATLPGAPVLWPDAPDNVCFQFENGDKAAVEAAFQRAAKVARLDLVNNRIILSALETRGAVGEYDPGLEKFTLTTTTQMPHGIKANLCDEVFHIAPEKLRVLVGDVGGSFGGKNAPYPEYVLTLYAARRLGRPVKWISERMEAFATDYHGRDNRSVGQLALDTDGTILALKVETEANLGAYLAGGGAVSPVGGTVMLSNTYRIPAIYVHVRGVYTNTVPTAPYRGAGRPEATYLVERLMDRAADILSIDRNDFRRRNIIPLDEFPYVSPAGMTYDSADVHRVMDKALDRFQQQVVAERRAEAKAAGWSYGIGMSNYIERCGGGAGLGERAEVVAEPGGRVTVYSGSQSNGQGHETAFAQIVNEQLDIPLDRITVVQGDTDRVKTGTGTGGSWSIPMGGGAVSRASDDLARRLQQLAADEMEAAVADVTFEDGRYQVAGTDIERHFSEILDKVENATIGAAEFVPEHYTFPYGCHIAEVLVDPETGEARLIGYAAVHDFGRALNPRLLEGQVHGGVVQGIGQAMMEQTAYDADGQLLSGTFMDYWLPRAHDLPPLYFQHVETPTTRNPMGVKGCGEAGATGAPPAVMNAILDAVQSHVGRRVDLDMPATSQQIWQAIQRAQT